MLREHEHGNRGEASTSQEMPKMTSKPPEAGKEAWDRVCHSALKRSQTLLTLISGI